MDGEMRYSMPLPWHERAWRSWTRLLRQDRVPSALIVAGARGLGKSLLAGLFARSLLCSSPTESSMPCGACAGCRQYAAGSHPDLHRLSPEAAGKPIVVDQVRGFSRNLFLTSHYGGRRVGVVKPLDAMNMNAANSFLKTLEEPPAGVHMLMVCQRVLSLPATIRSRCQILQVRRPSREEALTWLRQQLPEFNPLLLEQAGGAPLKALALHEGSHAERLERWVKGMAGLLSGHRSPIALAAEWEKEPLADCLGWLEKWLMDAYRIKLGLGEGNLANAEFIRDGLWRTASNLSWSRLRKLHAETRQANILLSTQANPRLLLESLLISWSEEPAGK